MADGDGVSSFASLADFIRAVRGTRRVMGVLASQELICSMMRIGWRTNGSLECIEGLPQDAQFSGCVLTPNGRDVCYIFTHPSFGIVEDMTGLPIVTVAWRQEGYNDNTNQ